MAKDARPLPWELCNLICLSAPNHVGGWRNRVAVRLGYATRLGYELRELDCSDLAVCKESGLLLVKGNKTPRSEQIIADLVIYFAKAGMNFGDAVPLLQSGKKAATKRGQEKKLSGKRLSAKSLTGLVQELCNAAGMDGSKYGFYSLRCGHDTDVATGKADDIASDASIKWNNIKRAAVEIRSAEEAFAEFTPSQLLDILVKKWEEAAINFNKDKLLPNPWDIDWYCTVMWERVL